MNGTYLIVVLLSNCGNGCSLTDCANSFENLIHLSFNNVEFNNEFNFPLFIGLADRMWNTILASKCLQYKISNWQRVVGCGVIIGCRRRLKQSSSTADSLVISFGLNENHGLNPSKEIRKMWAHYWCPRTGWCLCIVSVFFPAFI